jgi:DNA methylase
VTSTMLMNGNAIHIPIADESVDMIFTDPPYLKRYIETYKFLANEAARILRPSGFIATMCGEAYINQIISFFDHAGLTYYWLYTLGLTGRGATCWRTDGRKNMPIGTPVKHVLVYSKGLAVSRTATTGYYKSNGKDKEWHKWGQDIESHRYWVDCFSMPGDLILDPFCGGGTTGVACEILNRRYILMDLDINAVKVTRNRLNQIIFNKG